jgi:hypothetical protein
MPLVGLGSVLTEQGELGPAEGLLREGVEVARRAFPAGHVWIAEAESALGGWLAASGRGQEAEPLLAGSAGRLRAAFGEEHTSTRTALKRLADVERVRAAR